MAEDPYSFLSSSQPPAASPTDAHDSGLAPPVSTPGADPFSFLSSTSRQAPQKPEETQENSDPLSFLSRTPKLYGPPVGQAPAGVLPPESKTWYGKAWDWANSSFIDPDPIKRW